VTTYVGNPDHGSSAENVSATAVLLSSVQRITGDSYGNLYYTDSCKIRKVLAGSRLVSTMIGTGACTYGGENRDALSTKIRTPLALWFDTVGNLIFGDDGNNRIRKWSVATGLVATIAGNGTSGFSDGLPATSAMFKSVYGVVGDTNRNIYFSDKEDNRVRKITTAGILVTYAGNGGSSGFTENSLATSIPMVSPSGLQIDSSGKLYVSVYPRVVVIDPSATLVTTFVGTGSVGYSGDGGSATSAAMSDAYSTWLDVTNSLFYLTQEAYYRIRKVASNIITTFAGNGYYSFAGDGESAKNAQLQPYATFIETTGDVYISDRYNCRVRLVNTAGIISTVGGTGVCGSNSGDNGPFSAAALSSVRGIWKDTVGNLYFGTTNRVRKVAAGTNVITTIGGGGSSQPDNIPATSYSMGSLTGLWGDTSGNTFFADFSRHNVKKMSLSSSLLVTVAGTTGSSGFVDNVPAASGKLYQPEGIWVNTMGTVFIADDGNVRIRKVENGFITTIAGTGSSGFNDNGHLATATNLYDPSGVFGDSNGNIYIVDTSNKRIRMVSAVNSMASIVTTIIGSGSGSNTKGWYPVTAATLSDPRHVALDTNGNFYVVDHLVVRKTVIVSAPTGQPSRQPTEQPSGQPSCQPSRQPSGQPSRQPTLQPFSFPTTQPSSQPTRQPSVQPTAQPTQKPSGQPTIQPSNEPSSQPSLHPRAVPSSRPSPRPSSQPTRRATNLSTEWKALVSTHCDSNQSS
jgi:hypothetical protein